MYKKLVMLLMMMPLVITAVSCGSDSDGDNDGGSAIAITISSKSLNFDGNAGSQAITINANHEWASMVSDDWITVDPNNSVKESTTVNISVKKNDEFDGREGTVTILCGSARETIKVVQAGGDGVPDPDAITCPVAGYKLVWNDEFDKGNTLNSTDWTHEVQGPGWVNHELQTYVNEKSPNGGKVTEIKNGALRINCFKENGKIYSGRVYAKVNTGWQYGYIEARIKLPKGKGTWPAFWMMPCNVDWSTEAWPYCGEIDIMEEVGCVPNEVSSSLHASGHNHTNNTQVTHAMTIDNAEGEFHVYALEWTSKNITTYVDGKVQLKYDNPNTASTTDPKYNWPYDRPYYVILNLAWGGDWGGMWGVDESALPITMEIDYVRVFQKK